MVATAEINNRKDILLLLLYSPGVSKSYNEPIEGKTRLVKMLFLFKTEVLPHFRRGTKITEENFYEFFPWDFGPFSAQVYDDIAFFMLRGFVESSAAEGDGLPESAAEWEKWLGAASGFILLILLEEEKRTFYVLCMDQRLFTPVVFGIFVRQLLLELRRGFTPGEHQVLNRR